MHVGDGHAPPRGAASVSPPPRRADREPYPPPPAPAPSTASPSALAPPRRPARPRRPTTGSVYQIPTPPPPHTQQSALPGHWRHHCSESDNITRHTSASRPVPHTAADDLPLWAHGRSAAPAHVPPLPTPLALRPGEPHHSAPGAAPAPPVDLRAAGVPGGEWSRPAPSRAGSNSSGAARSVGTSGPGSGPGSAANSVPASTAGSAPGSTAGSAPGSTAGSAPGSAPGSSASSLAHAPMTKVTQAEQDPPLARTLSASSTSSANSTSSIEAAPFRAPPRGNMRRPSPAPPLAAPVAAPPVAGAASLSPSLSSLDTMHPSAATAPRAESATPSARERHIPKQPDYWVYRNGPGLSTTARRTPVLSGASSRSPGTGNELRSSSRTPVPGGAQQHDSSEEEDSWQRASLRSRGSRNSDQVLVTSSTTHAPLVISKRPRSRPSSRASRHSVNTRDGEAGTRLGGGPSPSSVRFASDLPVPELPADDAQRAPHSPPGAPAPPEGTPLAGAAQPTPAEIVRMEARAGVARAPSTPSGPFPGGLAPPITVGGTEPPAAGAAPEANGDGDPATDAVIAAYAGNRRQSLSDSRQSDQSPEAMRAMPVHMRESTCSSNSTVVLRTPSPIYVFHRPEQRFGDGSNSGSSSSRLRTSHESGHSSLTGMYARRPSGSRLRSPMLEALNVDTSTLSGTPSPVVDAPELRPVDEALPDSNTDKQLPDVPAPTSPTALFDAVALRHQAEVQRSEPTEAASPPPAGQPLGRRRAVTIGADSARGVGRGAGAPLGVQAAALDRAAGRPSGQPSVPPVQPRAPPSAQPFAQLGAQPTAPPLAQLGTQPTAPPSAQLGTQPTAHPPVQLGAQAGEPPIPASSKAASQTGTRPRVGQPGSPPELAQTALPGGAAAQPALQSPPSATGLAPPVPAVSVQDGSAARAAARAPAREAPSEPRFSRSKRTPDDFAFGEILGEGSFSTVIKAWDIHALPPAEKAAFTHRASALQAVAGTGTAPPLASQHQPAVYAIKVLDKVHILREKKQKYVNVEKEALGLLLHHPGIITLYWTFQDRESLYFVLELAPNGELLHYIQRYGSLDLTSATYYAAQLADTIDGMHQAGVIHRDIKPENVLLDAHMRIRVTDFGSAKLLLPRSGGTAVPSPNMSGGRSSSFVGTAEYVSPELLGEKVMGFPSDWWAFGCVLFQMLAGSTPFKGPNEFQTFQRVMRRDFRFPPDFPPAARELIDQLLRLDPAHRAGAREVKSHPFFASVNFATLWRVDVPPMRSGLVTRRQATERTFSQGLKELEQSFDAMYTPLAGPSAERARAEMYDAGDSTSHRSSSSARLDADEESSSLDTPSNESDVDRLAGAYLDQATSHDHPARGAAQRPEQGPAARQPGPALGARPPNTANRLQVPASAPEGGSAYDELILPGEMLLYSSPITLKKTGAGSIFSKRCQLLLTSFPRLLCVRENSKMVKVLSEVLLRPPPPSLQSEQRADSSEASDAAPPEGSRSRTQSFRGKSSALQSFQAFSRGLKRSALGTQDTDSGVAPSDDAGDSGNSALNCLVAVEQRGDRMFVVQTPLRQYVYEDPAGDPAYWVRCILGIQQQYATRP